MQCWDLSSMISGILEVLVQWVVVWCSVVLCWIVVGEKVECGVCLPGYSGCIYRLSEMRRVVFPSASTTMAQLG